MRRSQLAIVGALIALCAAPATYAAATVGHATAPTAVTSSVSAAVQRGAVTLAAGAATAAAQRRATPSTHRRPPAHPAAGPTPTRSSPAGPAPVTTGVTRSGTTLLLNGRPWKFTGVNNYGAATDYGVNYGCGAPTDDLDLMFHALRPDSVVRFWAFQALGWNNKVSPGRIDFTGIDRVVHTADADHQHLIVTLSDQAGVCDDGHWHDQAWYDGGYADPRPDDDGRGLGNLSYRDWVTAVVTRYRNDPSIAFWEPVNEPQDPQCSGATGSACYDPTRLSCPGGSAESIESFFTAIGQQIRALDPHHLISLGAQSGGQCGITGTDLAIVAASPGIDLLTYHDYDGDTNTFPGGLQQRLQQAADADKPLAVEEAGLTGGTGGCGTEADRATHLSDKITAAFANGAVGYLPWWYSAAPTSCGQDFGPRDPIMQTLRTAPAS